MDHPRAWATIPCALFLFALVLLTVSTGTIAQVTESKQSQLQLEDFFQSPSSHQVTLSPDGTKIAWIYATDSSSVRQLKVLDIASQSVKKVLASPNILRPIWHKTSDSLFVVTQTAMLLISIEEQRARKTLLRFDRNLNQRFFKYDTAEDVVYFSEEDERSHRIFSLSQGIDKGKKLLLESQQRIQNLFHFPDHNALFYTLEFNDHLEIMAKEQENTRSLRSCDMVIRCNLLGVNLDERILFIDSNAQSRIDSVSSLHLDTLTETILMVDPEGVSDREFTKIANGQLLYTSFFGDFRHFYSQQQHIQQAFDHLSEMFPEKNLSLQFSTDLSSWLVQVTAGNMQLPRYFVFSPTDAELTELTTNIELKRPKINEARLTKATPVTYKARDGLPIQSYVWLPKNVDLKNAPIVASIHGGPWKRLKGEYDLITQAMVDNGYIVFQPNFRASWGYGVDFIKAGAKTFGKGCP